jgi:16S rRNA (cytosine967-C5)-methyltransferase
LVNTVLQDGVSLGVSLDVARASVADPRVLAAAQDLAYGVLRDLGRLRFMLGQLLLRPAEPAPLSGLLLVGLRELDSAASPDYAVVNEAVDLAGVLYPRARGLVNAVLRNFLRRREALAAAARADVEGRWNFPDWWRARLEVEYPESWGTILDTMNGHPPMTLRVNSRFTNAETYAGRLRDTGQICRVLSDHAVMLERPVPVRELPGFMEGHVSVQDFGAQLAAPLLDADAGMRVLDACAAPGGKTGHLLERHDIDLIALDSDSARLVRVQDNLRRLGLNATLRQGDASAPTSWWDGRLFDRILLDAPCTASGVARRHPDGKWLKRPEDATRLAATQARLLDALWPLLRRGGKLLYATCSLFRDENDHQAEHFVRRHDDARRETLNLPGGQGGQLIPSSDHDGFFYARFVKT